MMIMIDVFVPSLYQAFDFEIDRKILTKNLIEDIRDLVEKQVGLKYQNSPYALYSYRKGEFLKDNSLIEEQGIRNGDRLILV